MDLVQVPMLGLREFLGHPLRFLQGAADGDQPLLRLLPQDERCHRQQYEQKGADGDGGPFPVKFPGGPEPLPFRHRFQIIPLRLAHGFGSLALEEPVLQEGAFLQHREGLLDFPFQAEHPVSAVQQFGKSVRMRPFQAVPQGKRLGLPSDKIQGIPPVAQFFIRERKTIGGRLLETMDRHGRILQGRVQ